MNHILDGTIDDPTRSSVWCCHIDIYTAKSIAEVNSYSIVAKEEERHHTYQRSKWQTACRKNDKIEKGLNKPFYTKQACQKIIVYLLHAKVTL